MSKMVTALSKLKEFREKEQPVVFPGSQIAMETSLPATKITNPPVAEVAIPAMAKAKASDPFMAAEKESRGLSGAAENSAGSSPRYFFLQAGAGLLLVVIGIFSVSMNFRTMAVLSQSQGTSVSLSQRLDKETERTSALEGSLRQDREAREARDKKTDGQLNDLRAALQKKEKNIADMTVDFNVLNLSVKDLAGGNQRLAEQAIELEAEVQSLKKDIREFKKLELIVNGR
ncbi:MAG: hypothetical protein WC552_06295 [Candidatus Omnitrophota bacterium]